MAETVGIARLHHPVVTLGPGRRAGIWFQGCSIHCAGCMARDTWDSAGPDARVPLAQVTGWVVGLPAGEVEGVTISGGEPFDQPEALAALATWLRGHLDPDADILVYSGYPLATLEADHADVLATVDAVVAEPFRQQAGGVPLRWRGSSNQRLVPLTDLGRSRYAEHLDALADAGLQFDLDGDQLRFIGVPRPGDLDRIEAGLVERGVTLSGRTWSRSDQT